jgi:hypothetical protein
MQKMAEQPADLLQFYLFHDSQEVKPQTQDMRPKIEAVNHLGYIGRSMSHEVLLLRSLVSLHFFFSTREKM